MRNDKTNGKATPSSNDFTVKRLDLKRETLTSLRARTGVRAGERECHSSIRPSQH
jgi:hypothetical protein